MTTTVRGYLDEVEQAFLPMARLRRRRAKPFL